MDIVKDTKITSDVIKSFSRANSCENDLRERTKSTSSCIASTFGSIVIVTNDDKSDDVSSPPTAPDGGWGWIIVVTSFVVFFIQGFVLSANNVLYVTVVDHFQSDKGVAGWIASLFAFSGNILGVIIGALINQYGSRLVCSIGAFMQGVGYALSYFLVNLPYLFVTVGVISGIGHAINCISSIVILQHYFDKKKTLALGIATTGLSAGAFTSPPALNALLNQYGLSGTYLMVGGICLQGIISSLLYRPLPSTRKDILKAKNQGTQIVTIVKDSIDFSVLRNPQLVMYLVGVGLFHYSLMGFYSHYFSRMIYLGTDRDLAIIFMTVMECATILDKVIFSFIGNIGSIDRTLLYSVLVTLDGFVISLFPLARLPPSLAVFGILHGLIAGGFFTMQAPSIVDVAGMSNIAKVTGMLHGVVGFAVLTTIPLSGYILDISGSYDIPFYVLGSVHLLGAGILLLLSVFRRTRWKDRRPI